MARLFCKVFWLERTIGKKYQHWTIFNQLSKMCAWHLLLCIEITMVMDMSIFADVIALLSARDVVPFAIFSLYFKTILR